MFFIGSPKKSLRRMFLFKNLPSWSNLIHIARRIVWSTVFARVTLICTLGNAQRHDPAISSGGDLVPLAIRKVFIEIVHLQRSNGRSCSTKRKDRFAVHQFDGNEIGTTTSLCTKVIRKQCIRFCRCENNGNVIRSRIQRRINHVG